MVFVIYAILAEQNISKLFLAAFVPGIMAALGYMVAVSIYVRLYPDRAGTRTPVPYKQRFHALAKVWPVVMIFLLVIFGIGPKTEFKHSLPPPKERLLGRLAWV